MTIIWCMNLKCEVRETECFVILDHFCPFTLPAWQPVKQKFEKLKTTPGDAIILHMCTIPRQSYEVWFVRYGVWEPEFSAILDSFLPFYSPNSSENQKFEKMENMPTDIIILHMCTINGNHMMRNGDMEIWRYGSWDMVISYPFTPKILTMKKKKKKKSLGILTCYIYIP